MANFKGIYQLNTTRKNPGAVFAAQISRCGRLFKIGTFSRDRSAAAAFDIAASRTKAWRTRGENSTNFPTLEAAYDELNKSDKGAISYIEKNVAGIVDELRRIDPTAERRHALAQSGETLEASRDTAQFMQDFDQAERCWTQLRIWAKNSLRVRDEKIAALEHELSQQKQLSHERAARIEELQNLLEQANSAAKVGPITFKKVVANLSSIITEDPSDEDEGSEEPTLPAE